MEHESLEEFAAKAASASRLRVEQDFGGGYVRLCTSEAERRQAAQDIRNVESVVIELLRNARDAHASHVFVAMSREGRKRILTVIDDGDGVPEHMHGRIFEPRVTSKLDSSHMDAWGMHGRGMALYSVAQNTQIACIKDSDVGRGSSFYVVADVTSLPEKTDQSTLPAFILEEGSRVVVRGPRNIMRTAFEFAIEERSSCSVFVGSPAEVAATMFLYGAATLSAIDRAFCNDSKSLPLVKRLATACDPATLASECASVGLEISERTARRIMDGQIRQLDSLIDQVQLVRKGKPSSKAVAKRKRTSKAASLSKDDVSLVAGAAKEAFRAVADRYYLEADVEPTARVLNDRLVVSVPLVKSDR